MCTEIEAKLKVDSLQEIEAALKNLGAEFVAEQFQTDIHFDNADSTLSKSDQALRLRRQEINGKVKFFLTYKGAREKSNFKKRREIEIEVSNGDSMQVLLESIGYKKTLSVEKKRLLWRFGGCEIALDELPQLGTFVEIEGPDDKTITEVQQKLGLSDYQHIPKSYAGLIKAGLEGRGAKQKQS
jgi:adenylate cyclase class 2